MLASKSLSIHRRSTTSDTKSTQRVSTEEIQKLQWLAEIMGGVHEFLFVLLQNLSGKITRSETDFVC